MNLLASLCDGIKVCFVSDKNFVSDKDTVRVVNKVKENLNHYDAKIERCKLEINSFNIGGLFVTATEILLEAVYHNNVEGTINYRINRFQNDDQLRVSSFEKLIESLENEKLELALKLKDFRALIVVFAKKNDDVVGLIGRISFNFKRFGLSD